VSFVKPIRVCLSALLLAALLAVTLALAPRAEGFVYWTHYDPDHPDAGRIGRANLDGTGVDRSFIAGAYAPHAIAVDAAHVYWTNNAFPRATIGRANLDGTGVDQSFIGGLLSPAGIAVDAAHVFWGDACEVVVGPNACSGFGGIGRARLDGTGVDESFITDAGPSGVAVDAAHVYWVDNVELGSPTIARANLDGTGVDHSFIAGLDTPTGVAVDAAHIYWGESNQRAIARANLDGTGIDGRFITRVSATGVAVDGAQVYWGEASGAIGRAKLDGTGVDRSFITRLEFFTDAVAVDALRSFSFGKVARNKEKGTAKLTVKAPGPGTLKLANTTAVKGAEERVEAKGKQKLPVRAQGETKKILKRKGNAKVKAEVTYAPAGDNPNIVANTDTKTVKLVKRR
jgi:virginiamycin B lyase